MEVFHLLCISNDTICYAYSLYISPTKPVFTLSTLLSLDPYCPLFLMDALSQTHSLISKYFLNGRGADVN